MTLRKSALAGALAFSLSASFAYSNVASAEDSAGVANPNPSAADRAGAKAANEIDKTIGTNNPITAAELAHAVPLSKIEDPAKALSTAQIKNPAGEAIATVSSVDVSADGKAKAVHADVGGFLGIGTRVVALDADKLVYLKARNLLVTRLTKEQIEALPAQAPANG